MSDLGDLFRKKLSEQEFEATPQNWSDMEKLLDNKKRRVFWLFNINLLGVLAVVLVAGGITIWFATKDRTGTTALPAQQPKIAAAEQQQKNTEEQETNEANTITNTIIGYRYDEGTVSEVKEDNNNRDIAYQEKSKQNTNKITKQQESKNTGSGLALQNNTTGKSIKNNRDETGKEGQLTSGISPPILSEAGTTGLPAALDLSLMNLIRFNGIDNNRKPDVRKLPEVKTIDPANYARRKINFYAGVYGGLMFSDKTVSTSDHAYDDHVSRRKAEEKGAFTYNTGIDIGFTYGRWIFGTGINYHQQTEASNYKNQFNHWTTQDSNYWDIVDNGYYVYNTVDYWLVTDNNYWSTGDTTVIFWNSGTDALDTTTVTVPTYVVDGVDSTHVHYVDSVYVPQFDSTEVFIQDSTMQLVSDVTYQQKRRVNKISYIEIPLLVGYEFPVGRFSLTAKTGVGIGILSRQDITYLRTNLTGIEKYSVSTTNKMVWNYLFRFGANYYLSKHVALDVESFFRANLNNVFSKEVPVQQKYWNMGLNVGVSYKF